MVPPLSYKSQTGYYNLRVNPTLEQVVGTVRNPLRVPLPDRAAKWFALGPYRSLLLDQQELAAGYDRHSIEYQLSQGKLPEYAAHGQRPSEAGNDPIWDRYDHEHEARQHREACDHAADMERADREQHAAHMRRQMLYHGYGVNRMNPTVEAHHDELYEAGVRHNMPATRVVVPRQGMPAPPRQFAAYGQPEAREFSDFHVLNMGDPASVRAATLTPEQNMTYERARDMAVGPTWSS
jgi:hypothetical protein